MLALSLLITLDTLQAAPNSAALGGAYRAKYCYLCNCDTSGDLTFSDMLEPVTNTANLVAQPNKDAAMVTI